MNLTQIRNHKFKLRKITWYDPQSQIRVELEHMIKEGLATCVSVGEIVYADKGLVVIRNEKVNELGDYTNIHPALIQSITKH